MKRIDINKVTDLKVIQVIAVRTTKECEPFGFDNSPVRHNTVEVMQYYDLEGNFLAECDITATEINKILDY